MEPKIQSSFIPKRPISSREVPTHSGKPMSLVFFISLLIFLGATALSGALFGYSIFLEKSIGDKGVALESARSAFAPAQIQTLQRLDKRLSIARTLLNDHLSLTQLFSLLEKTTLRSIRFDNFIYTLLPDGQVSLRMGGASANFSSIALQSEVFIKEPAIRNPIFSSLNLDQQGNAIFTFEALIDPNALSYGASVSSLVEAVEEAPLDSIPVNPESFAGDDTEVAEEEPAVESDTDTGTQ